MNYFVTFVGFIFLITFIVTFHELLSLIINGYAENNTYLLLSIFSGLGFVAIAVSRGK